MYALRAFAFRSYAFRSYALAGPVSGANIFNMAIGLSTKGAITGEVIGVFTPSIALDGKGGLVANIVTSFLTSLSLNSKANLIDNLAGTFPLSTSFSVNNRVIADIIGAFSLSTSFSINNRIIADIIGTFAPSSLLSNSVSLNVLGGLFQTLSINLNAEAAFVAERNLLQIYNLLVSLDTIEDLSADIKGSFNPTISLLIDAVICELIMNYTPPLVVSVSWGGITEQQVTWNDVPDQIAIWHNEGPGKC